MRFLNRSEVRSRFEGRTVAIVGSGPGCLDNEPGFIDSHDLVVRVNNYKFGTGTGRRTDVFYSYFGTAIKKSAQELKAHGVTLCLCKCPNAHAIQSEWHRVRDKMAGVDFRPHYARREGWWFCDTYIPTLEEFLVSFDLLGKHIPTTGFSAIFDVLSFNPKSVYLTGFDFFQSRIHNVNEPWHPKNTDDPIRHVPERELEWVARNASQHPLAFDTALTRALETVKAAA